MLSQYVTCHKNNLQQIHKTKLEDLKVLRRSPDLLNNVKIGQGQLQLIMEQILFLPYITRLFAYCKGGNFNIHIWALFGYFIS